MRNLILILVLALTALASTSVAGMSLDHSGGMMPDAMAPMDGHDCPTCPDNPMGERADHTACGDCAACGAFGQDWLSPIAAPIALTFSRLGTAPVAPRATSRIDADDPPPPRA